MVVCIDGGKYCLRDGMIEVGNERIEVPLSYRYEGKDLEVCQDCWINDREWWETLRINGVRSSYCVRELDEFERRVGLGKFLVALNGGFGGFRGKGCWLG